MILLRLLLPRMGVASGMVALLTTASKSLDDHEIMNFTKITTRKGL
jgi:hypothetical protein